MNCQIIVPRSKRRKMEVPVLRFKLIFDYGKARNYKPHRCPVKTDHSYSHSIAGIGFFNQMVLSDFLTPFVTPIIWSAILAVSLVSPASEIKKKTEGKRCMGCHSDYGFFSWFFYSACRLAWHQDR